MSSDSLTRVHAFFQKAKELSVKGHLLRAAENFGRAAEAAHAALGEDNLITVRMWLRQSESLACHSAAALVHDAGEPCVIAAHRAQCVALLFAGVETLERRRAAGTLLDGKCSAAEVDWRAAQLQRDNAGVTAAAAASLAALVGYEQFLESANSALLTCSRTCVYEAGCSRAQFQSFALHAVRAAELLQQPRHLHDVPLCAEAAFLKTLRMTVANAGAYGLDARLVQMLAGALQRLERSGVLQARRIDRMMLTRLSSAAEDNALHDAVLKSLTAPGLRSCALDGCGAREAHPAHFKSCAACRTVAYCCREHQVAGWPAHKKACKAARKEAAALDDGAGPSSG